MSLFLDHLSEPDDFEPIPQPPAPDDIDDLCAENYSLQHEAGRVEAALRAGMDIVRNSPNNLTFDLDSDEALAVFKHRVKFLECKAFQPQVLITKSKTVG